MPETKLPLSKRTDDGFSLIEVLIGLAITSVISSLIFASLATQMTQADAVRRSTAESLDGAITSRLFSSVVSPTVPSWYEEESSSFKGTPEVVSGTFVNTLFGPSAGLDRYRINLRREGTMSFLEIMVGEDTWRVGKFPLSAEFRYMGQSGVWRQSWPPLPEANPRTEDFQAFLQDYGLPVMMCVWDPDAGHSIGFEVRFENSGVLPNRTQDLLVVQ